jgi:hypothetical protein
MPISNGRQPKRADADVLCLKIKKKDLLSKILKTFIKRQDIIPTICRS